MASQEHSEMLMNICLARESAFTLSRSESPVPKISRLIHFVCVCVWIISVWYLNGQNQPTQMKKKDTCNCRKHICIMFQFTYTVITTLDSMYTHTHTLYFSSYFHTFVFIFAPKDKQKQRCVCSRSMTTWSTSQTRAGSLLERVSVWVTVKFVAFTKVTKCQCMPVCVCVIHPSTDRSTDLLLLLSFKRQYKQKK